MSPLYLLLSLFFLLATFFLRAVSSAFRQIQTQRSKKHLRALEKLFFYRSLQQTFFKKRETRVLFSAIDYTQNITRFCFAVSAVLLLVENSQRFDVSPELPWFLPLVGIIGFLILSILIGDLIPRNWAIRHPEAAIRLSAPIASTFLVLCFPLVLPFLKFSTLFAPPATEPVSQVKEKIIELIQETDFSTHLSPTEQNLIGSVVTFRNRIVREVMVPRVDLFCLPANTTLRTAAKLLLEEGYSRTPIYRDNIDNIIGVLMYKDILQVYLECDKNTSDKSPLDAPIETLVKSVIYTPETKKVSLLLQEFRTKQTHIAIVVDEYGGTEGIVTIEDILEELVGEIEDEYDDDEEDLYTAQPGGGWVVDARMSVWDIEEKFGIKIPHEGDYDTLGGYIFHLAGAIPSKGLSLHHENFDLEILSSNDRSIKKVRIIPLRKDE